MNVPIDLLYTKEHEWAKLESNKARIGITDYAQSSLGDITFIELPKVGKDVQQFKPFASIESVKAASDVYSPFSGKVVEVNDAVSAKPELLNQSPFDKAWLIVVEITDESEKGNLMEADKYVKHLKEVSH